MRENILQKLQESQERFWVDLVTRTDLFQEVLQHVQEGVLFIRVDGQLSILNPVAKKILNIPSNQILPVPIEHILSDALFGFSLKETLKFGISHKVLYRNILSQEIEIYSRFLCEGPSHTHGLLIILKDLTEKAKMQQALHRNERMQRLGEMVSSTTHEIRNSLGGIRGYASLLYRDLMNHPSLQDMAHFIIEGTKALEKLVTKILQYARPIQVTIQSHEIGSFLRQFVKWVKVDPGCPENIEWNLHIPQESIVAPIDLHALRAALLNLIFNSFHAMPRGGTLTISLMKVQGCYQIAISDTGIGMDEEQLKKIFSPFFTTKQGGNGLGLVEVQKVIQAHYGAIDVRSIPQKGTTFTLTLPLKRS